MNSKFLLSSLLLVVTFVFHTFLGTTCHGQHHGAEEGSPTNNEEVDVRFMTRVRRKRGLDSHDYHIIQVERPGSNSTLQIHLTRSDGLVSRSFQFVIRNETNEETVTGSDLGDIVEPLHCIYSGPVIGNSAGLPPIAGEAVFSACHDHEGFTGVISTTKGQYFLRPQSFNVRTFHTSGREDDLRTDMVISHKLSLVNEVDNYGSAATCQVVYAPEEVPGPNASYAIYELDVNFAHSSLLNIDSRLVKTTGRSEVVDRVRRSADDSEDYVVELAIFADEAFITAMEKKLDTKSYKTIKNYALRLAQAMQLYYDRPSISPYIQFRVVHLEFFVKNPADLHTNHGSLEPYLESFCKHASKRNNQGQWDHALLLTGLDLRDETGTSPVGAAYVKGMCRTMGSCSVIEGTDFKAGNIMAHEMGHSLGLEHDGSKPNANCSSSAYLMAPYLQPNQLNWSTCSNENLKAYLKEVEIPSFFRRRDCLKSSVSEKPGKYYKYSKKLPGEYYSADAQCQMHDPNHPIAVTPMMKNKVMISEPINVCKLLFCTDSSKPYAYFQHPALEGTECDKGKWCRRGDCVTKK